MRIHLLIICVTLTTIPCPGQSPGGTSANLVLWLKADQGTSTIADGQPVGTWTDASPASNDAFESSNQPTYRQLHANFNPSVTFDGFAQSMTTTMNSYPSGSNPRTLIAIASPHLLHGGDRLIFGYGTVQNDQMHYVGYRAPIHGALHGIWGGAGDANGAPNFWVENLPGLITGMYDGLQTTKTFANGGLVFVDTDGAPPAFNTNLVTAQIGSAAGTGGFNWDGEVSEIILYNKYLTDQELQQVHSYLSIKYGLTLDQTMPINYLASDGISRMWDSSAPNAGTYNQDIFGIGRDDASGLGQIKSKSENSDAIITILAEGESSDDSNTPSNYTFTDLADLEFLTIANDGGSAGWTQTGTSANYLFLERQWLVQETGDVGAVQIEVDVADTDLDIPAALDGNYHFVYDTDSDGDLSDETPIAMSDQGGDIWRVTGVNLGNGQKFTFAIQVSSPGGVNGLIHWLRADLGVTGATPLTAWADGSGFGSDVTTIFGDPSVVTGWANFHPTIDFDGNDGVRGPHTIRHTTGEISVFVVNKVEPFPPFGGRITYANSKIGETGWNHFTGFNLSTIFNPQYVYFDLGPNSGGAASIQGNVLTENRTVMTGGTYSNISNNMVLRENGLQIGSTTVTTAIDLELDRWGLGVSSTDDGSSNRSYLNGQIAEAVLFQGELSAYEIQRVESYLALKYGFTLNQNSATDYLASDGTTKAWDASVNAIYNQDIFGMGRDDDSGLDQRVSKSFNAGTLFTVALDADFTSANNDASRTTEFSADMQFLTFAHNGGATTTQTTEMDANRYTNRITREWQVQNTGSVGGVSVKFDGFADYDLLSDTDGDFSTTGDQNRIAVLDENGEASGVIFTDNAYITLAKSILAPGGVSTNLSLWLKADQGTDTTTDGQPVETWNAGWPSGGNAVQTTTSNKGLFVANAMNFNPAVELDGSDDVYNISGDYVDLNNDATLISAIKRDANTNRKGLILGAGTSGDYWGFGTQRNDNPISSQNGVVIQVNPIGGSAAVYPLSATQTFIPLSEDPLLISVIRNGNNWSARSKGTVLTTNTFSPVTYPTNSLVIGHMIEGNYFDGKVTEIITYSDDLTTLQQQQVESYLALKYGITLDQSTAQDYLASDGTTKMWDKDAANASTYNHDIFGIGRDDLSGLGQIKSKSENSDAIITLLAEGESSDDSNSPANYTFTDLNDLEFLAVANDGGNNVWTVSGAPGLYQVLEREWAVQEIGDVGALQLEVDMADGDLDIPDLIGGTGYYLIIDGDGNGDYSNDSPILMTNVSGEIWRATGVTLDDGDRFTLATLTTVAPGGIDADLALWFKADQGLTLSGTDVTQWGDQSGQNQNLNNFFIDGTNPDLTGSVINFNPAVSFPDVTDRIGRSSMSYFTSAISQYIVFKRASNDRREHLVSYARVSGTANGFLSGIDVNGNLFTYVNGKTNGSLSLQDPDDGIPHIWGTTWQSSNGAANYFFDGENVHSWTTSTSNSPSNGTLVLAEDQDAHGGGFNPDEAFLGDIAEIVTYLTVLSAAEVTKVESYLALKYGITLSNAGGGTAGDYISNNGVLIWDASTNAAYHDDVIGIGRDDGSDLLQKQSRTLDDSTAVYLSTLAADNDANSGTFKTDRQFLLIGRNDGKMCATAASSAELPASVFSRIEREWKVENTGFEESFSIDLQLSNCANLSSITTTDLILLVDEDGDFANATVYDSGDGLLFFHSNGRISISGISLAQIPLNSTRYFTLGSNSLDTPLPIELGYFRAVPDNNNDVRLEWLTYSETNNDYFTIERSKDIESWEKLLEIQGVGNSSSISEYSAMDLNPFNGTSYYRLKQTDYDGQFSYSPIAVANLSQVEYPSLIMFPNPTKSHITIKGGKFSLEHIKVYNMAGQDVTSRTEITIFDGDHKAIINLLELMEGSYLVKAGSKINRVQLIR